MSTATADPVTDTFHAALAKAAGQPVAPPPDIPPPPAVDAEAPHGRAADGTPLAPFGVSKRTGKPNKKPPGPGRPRTATAPAPQAPARAAGSSPAGTGPAGEDFAGDLQDFADSLWIGMSGMRGGRLGPLRLPDTRPYALAWHQATPQLVVAWTQAARQNAQVRGYVRKLSGDGSMAWVIGVGIAMGTLASGMAAVASAPAEERAGLAAVNDRLAREYALAQVAELGIEIPEVPEAS